MPGAWWWPGDVMAASFDCGPCAICPVVSCCHSGHRVRGGANWQQTAPQCVSHQSVSVVHRYMCEVSACQSGTMPQLWAGGLLLIWSRAHSSQLTMTGRLYVVNLPLEYTDKRCSYMNRIRCPTIALHTCIAFKKLSLAPVVLNSYNQQLGSGINHK